MIAGGNATLYVSDLGRSIRFYVEIMGFKLVSRHGDHWAEVDAGEGLVLGLHPGEPKRGSTAVGFTVDVPIEQAVAVLDNRGVKFEGEITRGKGPAIARFVDPDGNPLYLTETTRSSP
jgi:catechol 2,3-dioxygenase-like lactoylglutathione lyase family enzyme